MVLVDTSIWIRFLTGRQSYRKDLTNLLDLGEVAAHDLVFGELLIGDSGGRKDLLNLYTLMTRVETLPHQEVAHFVLNRKLNGRGVGWIDVHLLASAIVNGIPIWTADANLAALAAELGIEYRIPRPH